MDENGEGKSEEQGEENWREQKIRTDLMGKEKAEERKGEKEKEEERKRTKGEEKRKKWEKVEGTKREKRKIIR